MVAKTSVVISTLILLAVSVEGAQPIDAKIKSQVVYLNADGVFDYNPLTRNRGFFEGDLRIYCHRAKRKAINRFFETVELQLDIESDDYKQYEGATPTEVQEHYEEHRSFFSFDLFTTKRKKLRLSPFQPQCIGIETTLPYHIRLHQIAVNYMLVLQLVVGVCIFLFADKLSHNALFYYMTGVSLGVCLSLLLIVWLASRLMPRRPLMYGMLLGGWTIGLYVVQKLWVNLQIILQAYRVYVFWYILVTGFVSFLVCYFYGPPKNPRSKQIIKWILQTMAIGFIYFSSYYEEASLMICAFTFISHFFPKSVIKIVCATYRRWFPPKRRLLTCEEYYDQGIRETEKALNDLRHYANSPYCKTWKVISKLRDPQRFASFVEGDSHLNEEEVVEFENSRQNDEMDESDISSAEDYDLEYEQRETPSYKYRSISTHFNKQHTPQQQALPRRCKIAFEEMSDEEYSDASENERKYSKILPAKASPSHVPQQLLQRASVPRFNQQQSARSTRSMSAIQHNSANRISSGMYFRTTPQRGNISHRSYNNMHSEEHSAEETDDY